MAASPRQASDIRKFEEIGTPLRRDQAGAIVKRILFHHA